MKRNLFLKLITSLLCLLEFSLSCENNCFLGGGFFSAPVDIKGCCRYDKKDENCEYYTQMLNSVICFRCKLGFEWDNNECVPFKTEDDGNSKLIKSFLYNFS